MFVNTRTDKGKISDFVIKKKQRVSDTTRLINIVKKSNRLCENYVLQYK